MNKQFKIHSVVLLAVLYLQSCGGGGGSSATPSADTSVDPASCAEVIEAGEIRTPFTLINTASACDYYLQGRILVGATVTVEPGTTIVAAQDAEIVIDEGAISAVGTADNRITLRGQSAITGFWKGVTLYDARASRIEFVDIKDAGQTSDNSFRIDAGLDIHGSIVSLVNISVSNSYVNGLSLEYADTEITEFSNNRFYGNELAGIVLPEALAGSLDEASDYLGEGDPNGEPVVRLNDEASDIGTATWRALNAPYEATTQIGLSEGDNLTLLPGVRLITTDDTFLEIFVYGGGSLTAEGTAGRPVEITSQSDATARFIEVSNNGTISLNHVVISDYDTGVVADGGDLTVANTEFRLRSGWGINCTSSSDNGSVVVGENVTATGDAVGVLNESCL